MAHTSLIFHRLILALDVVVFSILQRLEAELIYSRKNASCFSFPAWVKTNNIRVYFKHFSLSKQFSQHSSLLSVFSLLFAMLYVY